MRVWGARGRSPAAGRSRTGASPRRSVPHPARCVDPAVTTGGTLPMLDGGVCLARINPTSRRAADTSGIHGLVRPP